LRPYSDRQSSAAIGRRFSGIIRYSRNSGQVKKEKKKEREEETGSSNNCCLKMLENRGMTCVKYSYLEERRCGRKKAWGGRGDRVGKSLKAWQRVEQHKRTGKRSGEKKLGGEETVNSQ